MQTATFVRTLLLANGMSHKEAADVASMTVPTLRRRLYENSFTLAELARICKFAGMEICVRDKGTGDIKHIINDPEELKR